MEGVVQRDVKGADSGVEVHFGRCPAEKRRGHEFCASNGNVHEKTHVVIWISFFSILYGIFDANLTFALFSILGAFFPNMDWLVDKAWFEEVKILIAKRMRGSASELRGMVFHNIWALITFSLVIRWAVSGSLLPTLFFASGYSSHLIADSLTRSGIYWLWPYGHILGGNGNFYSGGPISDGGSKEFLLQVAIIALAGLIFMLKLNVTMKNSIYYDPPPKLAFAPATMNSTATPRAKGPSPLKWSPPYIPRVSC